MFPSMFSDHELDWLPSHFEPWLRLARLPVAIEPIRKAAPSRVREVISREATMLARDVAATGCSWDPFRDKLADVAEDLGMDYDAVEPALNGAYTTALAAPAKWVQLARTWIRLGNWQLFSLKTGTELASHSFDLAYREENPEPFCQISDFLIEQGFMATVERVTQRDSQPIGFFDDGACLCFNAAPVPVPPFPTLSPAHSDCGDRHD